MCKLLEKKTKLREKEQKILSKYIRRQLAWSSHTQSAQKCRGEQYLEFPRALFSHDGVPHKGQKVLPQFFLLLVTKIY